MRNKTGMQLTDSLRPPADSAEDHGIVNGIVVGLDAHAPRVCDASEFQVRQGQGKDEVWQPPWQREHRFPRKQEMQVSGRNRYRSSGAVCECAALCGVGPTGCGGMCGVGSVGLDVSSGDCVLVG